MLVLRNGKDEEEEDEEDDEDEEEDKEGEACLCRCCRLGLNGGMLRLLPMKAAVLR